MMGVLKKWKHHWVGWVMVVVMGGVLWPSFSINHITSVCSPVVSLVSISTTTGRHWLRLGLNAGASVKGYLTMLNI